MIVKFKYTQKEIVDASKRLLNRSKAIRRGRLQGLFLVALLTWLMTFAVFFRHPATGAIFGTLQHDLVSQFERRIDRTAPCIIRAVRRPKLVRLRRQRHGR